jgi:hypothetical protein
MTKLKILVFGFILLVRPFSIILDSFQNKIQQKVVLFLSDFSNKMAKEVPLNKYEFVSAQFHIYILYLFLSNMKYI